MRYLNVWVVFAALLFGEVTVAFPSAPVTAQTQSSAQEKAASLRAQLTEVEAKQTELQTRLQKLDEDLKPESIEHSLAGVGSTHPEEEREQRRRQFEIERKGVQAQLDLLATSHTRLETAIARADADAYHQSATPLNVASTNAQGLRGQGQAHAPTASSGSAESSSVTTTPRRPRRVRRRRARAASH